MKLRTWLEGELRKLPEITVGLWKDTDLMCVFYRGKELAHFHDHEEIDVRLSQGFMKREKIEALTDSKYHPDRPSKSRWTQIRFQTQEETERLLGQLTRLIEDEYENTDWGRK